MAHPCSVCHEPHVELVYPTPTRLAALAPMMTDLLEAAREFVSIGPGDAVDFVEWLAIDTRPPT